MRRLPESALNWERDGRDWPHREFSQFVDAGSSRWHVQKMGEGPVLLMLHGTGASTHSWRDIAPILMRHATVLMPDLPGHGFTHTRTTQALSLPGMARAVGELLSALQLNPSMVMGHSAGAAVLARMCLDGRIQPKRLLSLNGALLPLHGLPAHIFSPLAKLFAVTSLVPRVVSWQAANPAMVERLVRSTGSHLDARGVELYQRLLRSPDHVGGVLNMMARWELEPLQRDLPKLTTPLTQIVGGNDVTVPPELAKRVQGLLPNAEIITLPGLGHLAHEEAPQRVVDAISGFMDTTTRELTGSI